MDANNQDFWHFDTKKVLSSFFWSCLEDRDEWQVRGKIKRHRVCVEQRLAALGDSQWNIAVVFLTESSMELIKLKPPACWNLGYSYKTTSTHNPQGVLERPRLANTWKINPGGSWLVGFPGCSPQILESSGLSPPVNTTRSTGVLLGTAGAALEGLLGLLLVSCSLIHSLNACVLGRGLGGRKSCGDGGDGWQRRAGATLSLCSHKVQGICFGVIFDILFLVHEATEYDQLPSALHHRV